MLRKNEEKVGRAVKAVNHPTLYREVAKIAIKVDKVRGGEMGELVINLYDDKKMRELIENFASQSFSMKRSADPFLVDEEQREDFITDMVQFAAAVMVATRQSARA
jgi:hypothetical protein